MHSDTRIFQILPDPFGHDNGQEFLSAVGALTPTELYHLAEAFPDDTAANWFFRTLAVDVQDEGLSDLASLDHDRVTSWLQMRAADFC